MYIRSCAQPARPRIVKPFTPVPGENIQDLATCYAFSVEDKYISAGISRHQQASAASRPSDQFRTASTTFFLYSCWVRHWCWNTSYLASSSFFSCLSLSGRTAVAGLLIRHMMLHSGSVEPCWSARAAGAPGGAAPG